MTKLEILSKKDFDSGNIHLLLGLDSNRIKFLYSYLTAAFYLTIKEDPKSLNLNAVIRRLPESILSTPNEVFFVALKTGIIYESFQSFADIRSFAEEAERILKTDTAHIDLSLDEIANIMYDAILIIEEVPCLRD